MGKWNKIRWVLRRVSVGSMPVAGAVAVLNPVAGGIIGIVGALAGVLAIDLPRDQWTDKERQTKTAPKPSKLDK